jgi:hypothetical protein
MKKILAYMALIVMLSTAALASAESQHRELGTVRWYRDYDEAVALSRQRGVPVFILFQEVPGCSTCVNFGRSVLSHPLVAEAIETSFMPLAIFNNRGGADLEVLSSFNEPRWNNPVIRIVDYRRRELTKRVAGDYSIAATTGAMIDALERAKLPVPEYLRIVHVENSPYLPPEKAVFAMHCFWSGELELGGIDGVVATISGYMGGKEVVEVRYDQSVVSYEELLRVAKRLGSARTAFVLNDRQEETAREVLGKNRVARAENFHPYAKDKYYLSSTPYRFVPMTPLQAIRVNRAVYRRQDPARYLSPRQQAILAAIEKDPKGGWKNQLQNGDFTSAWYEVARQTGLSDEL